jgi:glutathione S-transferase
VQFAYYVRDARAAAAEWAQRFGAGPFFVIDHIALADVVFRGEPGSLDHTSAYGWHGDAMIELVQQNCRAPSVFTGRPYGLHHAAYFAPDLDAELERLHGFGISTAMTATTTTGTRFAFADANAALGHYLELYADNPGLRAFYRHVRDAATNWDGHDAVRSL